MSDKVMGLTQVAALFYLARDPSARVGEWAYTMNQAARDALALYRAVSDALREEFPPSRELPACKCWRGDFRDATLLERDCPRHGPDRSTGEEDER